MSNKHQQTGRNWSKTVKNLNLSPQAMYFWPKMGQTDQKRIFPDTTLPLNDWKQLSRVSDQVTWNSDKQFSRKQPKTWFLSKNGQILDQKRSKNDQNFFITHPNLLYLVLNHKLGSKNNKRAMLGSLGGRQINKKHKNGGGQSKIFKNDNNR